MAELVTVVLADDAEDVLRVVDLQLRLSGAFTVLGKATTGAAAIDLAREHQPDLVVLDVSMPDVDGLAALPDLLQAAPSSHVVMLSGFSSPELDRRARELGAIGCIDKGVPLEELPDRLLRLLDGAPGPLPGEQAAGGAASSSEGEMVLARHQERFRTVFDQAAIGMATMTLTGTIVRANAVLVSLLGRDEPLVGRSYASLSAPQDVAEVRAAIDRVGSGAEDVVDCTHILQASGRWLHSTFASVQDEDNRALYILAQAEDVTAEREAALRLRASEERFKLLVESVQDYAIFMLDPDGYISTWNLGAERMKGYRAEDIIGQHFRVFYPEAAQRSKHPEQELAFATEHGRYEEEGWRVRKDGTQFWANVIITALFDDAGRLAGFGKVTRDVTEQRRSIDERERVAAELAAANASLQRATSAMADFVAVVAHELRSPVTAIGGAAGLLRQHWDRLEASEREEMLANISMGSGRLQGLISDLLVASRLEAGAFEFDIDDVPVALTISEVLGELRADQQTTQLQCDQSLVARADRVRFGQIVSNLISNALAHGIPPIRIEATRKDAHIEVRVRDAGSGVSDDLRGRLFEKFVQGSARGARGSGLGLFIVRELARGQGGDAWYDSGPGEETCFAVRLPAAMPAP